MRFRRIAATLGLIALIVVPSALALAFTDSDFPLPQAFVGVPYGFQLNGRAGCPPYKYAVISGALPPGITLSDDGNFGGTPTQTGTWGFYVDLRDTGCPNFPSHSQRAFEINVIPKVTITTSALQPAVVNVPYSVTLTADGGGTLAWSVSQGALPPGISLDPVKGVLSGTPTTVGSYTFQLFAKDSTTPRSDTKTLTLDVLAPLAATVGSAPEAEVGIPFAGVTPTATGGKTPYAWQLASGSLPPGLSLDPTTGAISGTPTTPGSYSLQIAVSDSYNTTAAVSLGLDVARQPAFRTKLLRPGKQGTPFQATLRTSGGVEPVRFKVASGRFPIGIRLDRKAGMIAGTPRSSGSFHFTVSVTDRLGGTAQQSYTLIVKAKPKK